MYDIPAVQSSVANAATRQAGFASSKSDVWKSGLVHGKTDRSIPADSVTWKIYDRPC
jgi:hypothetical protein